MGRWILLGLAVAVIAAGCFQASTDNGGWWKPKPANNNNDDRVISKPDKPGDMASGGGSVPSGNEQQQVEPGRDRPQPSGGGDNSSDTALGLTGVPEGGVISLSSDTDTDTSYNFIYIGRNDDIQARILAQTIGWAGAAAGAGFIAGLLVFRNNKLKIEAIIDDTIEDIEYIARAADTNGDGLITSADVKHIADKVRSKI